MPRIGRGVVAAVAALALGGYVVADVLDVAPGFLTWTPLPPLEAEPAPGSPPEAALVPGHAAVAAPMADLPGTAPTPSTAGLVTALARPLADPALGGRVALDVRDGATGTSLLAVGAERPVVPASTAKVLAALAIARSADLDTRLETRVVAGAVPDTVVLVAGGDTLLNPGQGDTGAVAGRAGLDTLAATTAAALRRGGTSSVRVALDDTLARGPAHAPGWEAPDIALGLTGPVAMLGTTATRAHPGRAAPADPPLATAQAFAAALARHGVQPVGRPARGSAPAGATQLAAVESAPLREVLALALEESDNALTESLARLAAIRAGVAPTFPAVAGWIRTSLGEVGVPLTGVALADASGLSHTSRVPTRTVADVLSLAATGREPALAGVVARLPVAGLSGTLAGRFRGPGARVAAGLVRGKTGSLTGVNALAGTLVDRDGRLLVYAANADAVPAGGTDAGRAALDRLVAALAGCGCR